VRRVDLTEGSVPVHLTKLTVPMIGGLFAIIAFNLTDTYFVARLGTAELAAISFTFPVVMVVGALAMGLGMGLSSVVSRAIGQGDGDQVRRLTTDGLILSFLVVLVFAIGGVLTLEPLFGRLGAPPEMMPLIRQYMVVWYTSVAVLVIPMVGNNAIRATGDAFTPSLIMMLSAGVNVILDPILIFGLLGAPRLELFGAALATAIARAISMVAALWVLYHRCGLLDFSRPSFARLWRSWRAIFHVALPSAATNLLMPVMQGVVVRLAAGFGTATVAAVGAGVRIEGFALLVPMAVGSALLPFVGQNWGARRRARVRRGQRLSMGFSFTWGVLCLLGLQWAATPVARLFSDDAAVVRELTLFLRILPLAYGFGPINAYITLSLNAIGAPGRAALVSVGRLALITLPAAVIGAKMGSSAGLFLGIALGNILAACASWWFGRGPFLQESIEES